jgi:hypothetical protein
MSKTYKASCFCGEVEIEATAEPAVMGYCTVMTARVGWRRR